MAIYQVLGGQLITRNIMKLILNVLLVLFLINCTRSNNDILIKDFEIVIGQKTLYARTVNWGLLGNHKKTIISSKKIDNNECNQAFNYCYNSLSPILYEVKNDTLVLYVELKSNVPVDFNSSIAIVQKKKYNPVLQQMQRDYEKKGLSQIY